MTDLASHVSWDEVLELARRIEGAEMEDTLGLELARLVIQFHAQMIGAPPKSWTGRTTPP